MKTKLLTLLLLNIIFSINSFAQSFQSESSVITYASGKVFSNTDKTVKIEITYDGIKVNGNLAYFNLEISVLSTNVALIKGYSLSNPDGTISFRINNSTGCIVQGSDSYCATSSNSSNSNNATGSNNYNSTTNAILSEIKKHTSTYVNKNGESIFLDPSNGNGTLKRQNGESILIKWSTIVTNNGSGGTERVELEIKSGLDGTLIYKQAHVDMNAGVLYIVTDLYTNMTIWRLK
jgi:hypothetical protein